MINRIIFKFYMYFIFIFDKICLLSQLNKSLIIKEYCKILITTVIVLGPGLQRMVLVDLPGIISVSFFFKLHFKNF